MAWIEKRRVKRSERYPQGATWRICDRDGRRAHVLESGFARRSDAEARLDALRGDRVRGIRPNPSKKGTTFEAFFPIFMERRASKLAPSTKALYEQSWKKHIAPALGTCPLSKVTRAEVKAFLSALEVKGVGKPMIRAVYQLVRLMFTVAQDEGIVGVNPAQRLELPKPKARKARYLSVQEVERLAAEVPERDRALVHLLAYTGLRVGEAAYLRVRHFDPMRRRLRIEGAAPEVAGRRVEGATKTQRSERTLVLSTDLADELTSHVEAFGSWAPDAYLFTTEAGSPLRVGNWRKRVFYPACQRASITPLPHVHDLRHTAASLAISAGAPLLAISRMLGHSSIKVTQDVYGDLYDEDLEALATLMAEKAAAGRDGLAVRPA